MSSRARTILVWILFAVGTLVLFVGSLTVWVKRQALDTNAWVDTSADLLENDQIRQALSAYIVDQLYQQADPEQVLQDELPENLQGLAGPLSGALRQPAERAVDGLLQRPRVQALWQEANRVAHERLLAVLEDETRPGISTAGGTVTLDLRTMLINLGEELGFSGQLADRIPEDAGQITILQSDQLEAAQNGVKAIKWLSWLVILVALGCYTAAVWLARGRRAMLRNVGVALAVVGILLLGIRRWMGNYIVDQLSSGTSVRDAVDATWLIGTSLLSQMATALIVYGVVILIGTWLAGPNRYATRARTWLAPTLRDRAGLAWGVVAAVYLLVVLWGPVPALQSWVGVLVLGALVALGFEAFRRVALGQLDTGDAPPPGPPPAAAA